MTQHNGFLWILGHILGLPMLQNCEPTKILLFIPT